MEPAYRNSLIGPAMVWQCPDIVPGLIIGSILPVRIVPQTIRQKAFTEPKERRTESPTKALETRIILKKPLPSRVYSLPFPSRRRTKGQAQRYCPVDCGGRPSHFETQTLCIPYEQSALAKACSIGTQEKYGECTEEAGVATLNDALTTRDVAWNVHLQL